MTIILTVDRTDRALPALALAAAQGAIGGAVHVHFDAGAISLLGMPEILAGLATAQSLGATVSLCPTGLADAALDAPPLPLAERIGLVALLAELDDAARLVLV